MFALKGILGGFHCTLGGYDVQSGARTYLDSC